MVARELKVIHDEAQPLESGEHLRACVVWSIIFGLAVSIVAGIPSLNRAVVYRAETFDFLYRWVDPLLLQIVCMLTVASALATLIRSLSRPRLDPLETLSLTGDEVSVGSADCVMKCPQGHPVSHRFPLIVLRHLKQCLAFLLALLLTGGALALSYIVEMRYIKPAFSYSRPDIRAEEAVFLEAFLAPPAMLNSRMMRLRRQGVESKLFTVPELRIAWDELAKDPERLVLNWQRDFLEVALPQQYGDWLDSTEKNRSRGDDRYRDNQFARMLEIAEKVYQGDSSIRHLLLTQVESRARIMLKDEVFPGLSWQDVRKTVTHVATRAVRNPKAYGIQFCPATEGCPGARIEVIDHWVRVLLREGGGESHSGPSGPLPQPFLMKLAGLYKDTPDEKEETSCPSGFAIRQTVLFLLLIIALPILKPVRARGYTTLLLVLTGLIFASRIYGSEHTPMDLLLGLTTGILLGWLLILPVLAIRRNPGAKGALGDVGLALLPYLFILFYYGLDSYRLLPTFGLMWLLVGSGVLLSTRSPKEA